MPRIKPKRITDAGFLHFLRSLPCLCSGRMGQVTAHHLLDTGLRGMGLKSPDRYAIPLDWKIHDALHRAGDETMFLAGYGITDAMDIADQFYECYLNNDHETPYDYIMRRFL
ncbi:DUF968 domain-containing protein [Dyadobacter psychrotolerans]|uniref:DUF968 domain-containing protein n=1 Tax=Dyadobacter psychrotolerans TaxID=2541721 RepID=A0A4R5E173_9BACT|nr:DUF968 domain-containing protein [Dyadobacter psychrotolerans]